MRYLLVMVSLLVTLNAASIKEFAQKNNYYTNYKTALAAAVKEDKPLMLVMVTHYCPWCRKFEKATLSKKKIDALVHKNFIPVILNREKDEFPKIFNTPLIPVVFFIDQRDEDGYWETRGYLSKSDFLKELKTAKVEYDKR